jgi:tRNA threonylcarbamoyladenosine biosynthesis protein TsaB
MIICIETATNLCSVALCDSSGVISVKESNEPKSHASMLTILIGELLKENMMRPRDLDAVAVSKGPGSYTGLRIGVSVAKGITYAASIPLIAIETTLSMFHGIFRDCRKNHQSDKNTLFCPVIDARRMEVYYALYNMNGEKIKDISAEIISEYSFKYIPESVKIIFFGDGVLKCKSLIRRKNIVFADEFKMSASHMYKPATESYNKKLFENVAYFEPFYLKEFITSKPRKNILG